MNRHDYLTHYGVLGMKWGHRKKRISSGNSRGKRKKLKAKKKAVSVEDMQKALKEHQVKKTYNQMRNEKLSNYSNILRTSAKLSQDLARQYDHSNDKPVKKRLDLSKMSDDELRRRINRAQLERQYNDLFAPTIQQKANKGEKYLKNSLEALGSTMLIGASALEIAKSVKNLRERG